MIDVEAAPAAVAPATTTAAAVKAANLPVAFIVPVSVRVVLSAGRAIRTALPIELSTLTAFVAVFGNPAPCIIHSREPFVVLLPLLILN